MTKIYPVLMVGGAGTRLWPVSRKDKPKQFQNLLGTDQTLFQETVRRLGSQVGTCQIEAPIIIGGARYLELIRDQLDEIGVTPSAIVLEPSARNTAAVAAIAAETVAQLAPDALALLMPSDHHVTDPASFRHAIADAANIATQDWIVTLGIAPTHAETGFGYIEAGEQLGPKGHKVHSFREKPDQATAQAYCDSGQYFWNGGIFLFPPALMLAELAKHAGDVAAAAHIAFKAAERDGNIVALQADTFEACRDVSIDYAVMEKTTRAAVQGPVACGWNDIGSWNAMADLGSATPASDHVIAIDSATSYLSSDGSVTVTAVGADDMIIVAHEGSVLVMPKSRAQDVKQIIAELKKRDQQEKL